MRTFGIIFIAVGLIGFLFMLNPLAIGAPLWVADRVPSRMALIKPGMTEPQIMAKLGLTGYRMSGVMGGAGGMHMVYGIRPGMNLVLHLETTRTGMTGRVVSTELDGSDASSRTTGAVSLVIIALGIGMLAIDTKLRPQLRPVPQE